MKKYIQLKMLKPDLVEQPKGGISVDSSVASTGTYTVKVIAGELQIVKNWMHKLRRKKHLDSQLQTKMEMLQLQLQRLQKAEKKQLQYLSL